MSKQNKVPAKDEIIGQIIALANALALPGVRQADLAVGTRAQFYNLAAMATLIEYVSVLQRDVAAMRKLLEDHEVDEKRRVKEMQELAKTLELERE